MKRTPLFKSTIDGMARRRATVAAFRFGPRRFVQVQTRSVERRRGGDEFWTDMTVEQARDLHAALASAIAVVEGASSPSMDDQPCRPRFSMLA